MFKNRLLSKYYSTNADCGLLALRLSTGIPLFLRHGLEKIFRFQMMAAHFPDPLHIGAVPSLIFALISDAICSVLLIFGLATRWAALIIFINIAVAWSLVQHLVFWGPEGGRGEVMILYLGAMLALMLAGGGKYSIDGRLRK